MSTLQRIIKCLAMAFAIVLIVTIFSGIFFGISFLAKVTPRTHAPSVPQTNESGEVITASNENMRALSFQGDITALKIDLNFCNLEISQGDEFKAETNCPQIQESQEGTKLKIKDVSQNITNSNYLLRLVIPSKVFEEIEINTGAGYFYADRLLGKIVEINLGAGNAQLGIIEADTKLEFEVGAGNAKIEQLYSTAKTDIELGAGNLNVKGGTLANAEVELGLGNADIQGEIIGQSKITVGMGKAKLSLTGGKDRYSFVINKGLGSVTIDGERMADDQVYAGGANKIKIDCGAGSVKAEFV